MHRPKSARRDAATKVRVFNHRPRRAQVLLRPAAFLKLMFCCHTASTEIGGFGISAANDPLIIDEFALVPQRASIATVEFDDSAVADHADRYADEGVEPGRCLRLWIHTHPGACAAPSSTDEETFARSFGGCDWAAMLIQSRGEENYCRLRFNTGPGGEVVVPVVFDWASLPAWLDENRGRLDALVHDWTGELRRCVVPADVIADAFADDERSWWSRAFARPDHFDPDGTGRSDDWIGGLPDEPLALAGAADESMASADDAVIDVADEAELWLAQYEEEVTRGER